MLVLVSAQPDLGATTMREPTNPDRPQPPPPGQPAADGPPAVPVAVWPCQPAGTDPPTPAGSLPPLLARRLITTYTRPGEVVLAAGTGASTLADTAAATGRTAVLDLATPPRVFPPLGAARAALAVVTPPAVSIDTGPYRRWARALTHRRQLEPDHVAGAQPVGGLLAVVVPPGYQQQALLIGQVIAAATHAGLDYLQHIVAVTAELREPHLHPAPTPDQAADYAAAREAGLPVHLPVHLDVIVFARRASHQAPTPQAQPATVATKQSRRSTGSADHVVDGAGAVRHAQAA